MASLNMWRGRTQNDCRSLHRRSRSRCPTQPAAWRGIAVTPAGMLTILLLFAVQLSLTVLVPQGSGEQYRFASPPASGPRVMLAEAMKLTDRECSGGYTVSSPTTFRVPWGDSEEARYNITIDGCTFSSELIFAPAPTSTVPIPASSVGVWVVVSGAEITGSNGQIRFDLSLVLGAGSGVIISSVTFPDSVPANGLRRLHLSGRFWDGASLFVTGFKREATLAINGLNFKNGSTGEIRGIHLRPLTAANVPTLVSSYLTVFDGSTLTLIDSSMFAVGAMDAISLTDTAISNGGAIIFKNVAATTLAAGSPFSATRTDITVTDDHIAASFVPSAGSTALALRKSTLRVVGCHFTQSGASGSLVPAIHITSIASKGIDGSLIHISGTTVEAFRQALYINTTAGPPNLPLLLPEPARDRVSLLDRRFFFYGPDTTIHDLLSDRNGNAAAHVVVEGCTFSSAQHQAADRRSQTVTVYFGDHVVFYYDGSNTVNGRYGSDGGVAVQFTRPSNYSHVSVSRTTSNIAAVYLEWSPPPPPFDATGPEWTPNNNTFVSVVATVRNTNVAPLDIHLGDANGAVVNIKNFLGATSSVRWGKCTDCFISVKEFTITGNVGNAYPNAKLVLGYVVLVEELYIFRG